MNRSALSRYRAERLLRKEFSGQRSKVLALVRSRLHAKGLTLAPADLEACYALAWHGLYATVLAGEHVENPSAWLVVVTFRRAVDESRSAGRQIPVAQAEAANPITPDLAGELDDRARLRQVFEGLHTLSKREREAASLCYLQGLSRAQAAERMGISEARMRKLMEGRGAGRPGVAGKMGELLDTIKAGGWCEQQSSLMRAFAFGVLEPGGERHTLAMAHCRECPACRAHVASLRGLAVVLPLPLFSPLGLAGANAGAGAGHASVTGPGVNGVGVGMTRAGVELGRGVSGSATTGLAGSLVAKLAAVGVVALGVGYAALGSGAHSSPPARPTEPSVLAGRGIPPAHSPALTARVRGRARHPIRRSSSVATRPSRKLAEHSAGTVIAPEFLPERSSRRAPSAPSPAAAAPARGSPRGAREFGIE
jgi:DNA-directed RNA polymerase specialized sigma24 family protein